MNLLLNPDLWWGAEGETPPMSWNPSTQRYEILSLGNTSLPIILEMTAPASSGDILAFQYEASLFATEGSEPQLILYDQYGAEVWAVSLDGPPVTGQASIECEEGKQYYFSPKFSGAPTGPYDFEAIITPAAEPVAATRYDVYELDRGWSFDGKYIPHFAIFNWYFGDNPTVYKTMQKMRIHGLAKGITKLNVHTNGIQTTYREDWSGAEELDLENPYEYVSPEFVPATEYADLANRGLAIQLKFEGRNTDLDQPEPAHVLQVLIPQTTPEGSGFSSN